MEPSIENNSLLRRINRIEQRGYYIEQALRQQDSQRISQALREEQEAYEKELARLYDDMTNGRSPALRKLAGTVYSYLDTMQTLAGSDLPSDIQCEGACEEESYEEAMGLLEEYMLDMVEQSLRACFLLGGNLHIPDQE
jgi:hypothetical protein